MTETAVVVGVWQHVAGFEWARISEVETYTTLSVELRHLQAGPWSMVAPYDLQASKIGRRHLLTFDLIRSGVNTRLMTGRIESLGPSQTAKQGPRIELSGRDVLSILGGALNWPTPMLGLNSQFDRYFHTGIAEDVLRRLVETQWVDRLQQGLELPPTQGRGGTIMLRERFSNLLEVIERKGRNGGIGVSMGLVNTSGTRANLRLSFYGPEDRSLRVRLSHRVGTLSSWSQKNQAPTGTRALILGKKPDGVGAYRPIREVTRPNLEESWMWPQELLVDAQDSETTAELLERGEEALNEAGAQGGFSLEATEAEGMLLGAHFWMGDIVLVEPVVGVSSLEVLSAAALEVGSSGVRVKLVPGSPDADADPMFRQASLVTGLREQVRALQREEA